MSSLASRFDALTSLRFFAALMIVIHHWAERYSPVLHHVPLSSGVSFFFVLSGFVIACAYPSFSNRDDIARFLIARVSRLAPAHWATMALALLALAAINRLGAGVDAVTTGLMNLLMLQSWVPLREYYFSFNSVAWSISTELGFYILYVIFSYCVPGAHLRKLAGMFLLSMGLLAAAWLAWDPMLHASRMPAPMHWVIYVFPLARFWEFLLGCWIYSLLRQSDVKLVQWRNANGNLFQVGALLIVLGALAGFALLSRMMSVDADSSPIFLWLFTCALAPVYGLVIFAFATANGALSRILQQRWLLQLGEASFLLYMIHRFVLNGLPGLLERRFPIAEGLGSWAGFCIYVSAAVAASWLIWRFIERQASATLRSWLLRGFKRTTRAGGMPTARG